MNAMDYLYEKHFQTDEKPPTEAMQKLWAVWSRKAAAKGGDDHAER